MTSPKMPEKAKETGWQVMLVGVAMAVAASIIPIVSGYDADDLVKVYPMIGIAAGMLGVGAPYRAARAKQKELQPHVDAIVEDVTPGMPADVEAPDTSKDNQF